MWHVDKIMHARLIIYSVSSFPMSGTRGFYVIQLRSDWYTDTYTYPIHKHPSQISVSEASVPLRYTKHRANMPTVSADLSTHSMYYRNVVYTRVDVVCCVQCT